MELNTVLTSQSSDSASSLSNQPIDIQFKSVPKRPHDIAVIIGNADYEKQGKELSNLARKNAQIEADKDKYLSILSKHNFEKLAIAKPGLMEIRFNKGTEEVIKEIENDTKNISELSNSSSD